MWSTHCSTASVIAAVSSRSTDNLSAISPRNKNLIRSHPPAPLFSPIPRTFCRAFSGSVFMSGSGSFPLSAQVPSTTSDLTHAMGRSFGFNQRTSPSSSGGAGEEKWHGAIGRLHCFILFPYYRYRCPYCENIQRCLLIAEWMSSDLVRRLIFTTFERRLS